MTANNNGQMSLMGFIDDAITNVFQPKEIKGKDGATVGTQIVVRGRKEIAEALNLKGKDNKEALDDAITSQGLAAFRKVRGEISGLEEGTFTLKRAANRVMGDGLRQITIVVKEVKKNKGPSDEQIAKAWGISVEDVQKMREEQEAKLKKQAESTIDA
jgi:hypothetical protein